MKPLWYKQFRAIFIHSLRAETADKERLITPLLFAVTMLLLFNFALGGLTAETSQGLFVGAIYLTSFFSLQLSYTRIFAPEQEDRAFDIFLSSSVCAGAWYLAKFCLAVLYGLSVLLPAMAVTSFIHEGSQISGASAIPLLSLGILAMGGLGSLGTLLSAMTLQSSGREMLFPIIYFPLTIPVLLAASQGSISFMNGADNTGWHWLGLLAGFDTIYLTLGLLLFGELTDAS